MGFLSTLGSIGGGILGGVGGFLAGGPPGAVAGAGLGSGLGGDALNLLGGGPSSQNTSIAPRSAQEQEAIDAFLADIQKQRSQQDTFNQDIMSQAQGTGPNALDQQIMDMFRQASVDAIGAGSPESLAEAQKFVDATFTAGAENRLRQETARLEADLGAAAGARGRSGIGSAELDRITQQRLQGSQDIERERASRTAEASFALPGLRQNAGLQGLQGIQGMQGINSFTPNFLSGLNAQAQNNRINLGNLQSGQLTRFLQERSAAPGTTITGPQAGTLAQAGGILSGVNDITKGISGKGLSDIFAKAGGGGGSVGGGSFDSSGLGSFFA